MNKHVDWLLEDIASNGEHIIIAKSIVKRIASNPLLRAMPSCLDIVNHGFHTAIFDDIIQSVFIEIMNIRRDGLLTRDSETKRLAFRSYFDTDRQGNIVVKPSYTRLYKAVYECLGTFSANNTEKDNLIILDLTYTDDNGGEHALTNKASNYLYQSANQWDGGLSDIVGRDDIKGFFKALKEKHTKTRFYRFCVVFEGLLNGLSRQEIADKEDVSLSAIDKSVEALRKEWKEYGKRVTISRTFERRFGKGIEGTISTIKDYKHKVVDGLKVDNSTLDADKCKDIADITIHQHELMMAYNLESIPDNNPIRHIKKVYSPIIQRKDGTFKGWIPNITINHPMNYNEYLDYIAASNGETLIVR